MSSPGDEIHQLLSNYVYKTSFFIPSKDLHFSSSKPLHPHIHTLLLELPDKITLLDSPMISISATMIRQKVERQEEINHLVPEQVAAFFYETHLK